MDTTIHIRLSSEILKAVDAEAEVEGRNRSAMLRRLIGRGLHWEAEVTPAAAREVIWATPRQAGPERVVMPAPEAEPRSMESDKDRVMREYIERQEK
jgi:Ribbon-helix-helix protein, copG family